MTQTRTINPEDVYGPAQLAVLRLQYSEEQIRIFANTFAGWEEEEDACEDLSSRWAYEWPGEDEDEDEEGEL